MRPKTKQGTGRRVQREGGREERHPQGLGNQSEGKAGAEVRVEEVGSVCQMKGSASRTVHGYRDNGMLASVHPRKHKTPEHPEFKRKSGERHGYRNSQVQRARPTPAWGTGLCHPGVPPSSGGLFTLPGHPGGTASPLLPAWPVVPGRAARAFSPGLPRRLLPLFCRRRPPSFVLNQCAPKISPKKTVVAF